MEKKTRKCEKCTPNSKINTREAIMIRSFDQAVNKSVNYNKEPDELDADFKIEVDGSIWTVYTVAMNHREFTCYCNEGHANFQVDLYGDRPLAELFDWQTSEEN